MANWAAGWSCGRRLGFNNNMANTCLMVIWSAADCLLGEASIQWEANVDGAAEAFGLSFVGSLCGLGLAGVIGTTGSS